MNSITVITPSRIHLALIDLNGGLGRVDGGIGLSLVSPGFRITARRADETEVVWKSPRPAFSNGENLMAFPKGEELTEFGESVQRAREILELLREKCRVGHAKIEIEESIPAHVGLGSGTQLSLGIAQAVCKLYGMDFDHREMAFLVGRGGTSGIGVAAFSRGGFIVDGGHKFSVRASSQAGLALKPLSNEGEKTSFLPSSASRGVPPPPVIARYDFPDWHVLVTIPNCRRISGEEEVALFQTLCPLPLRDVQSLSHVILMKLLPALVQCDLKTFGEAVDHIQSMAWKEVEIEKQDPIVRLTMDFLRDNGAHGVGLSSWGPAIFCFGEDLRALEAKTRVFLVSTNVGGTCFLTRSSNTGVMVIEEQNGVYGGRSETADLQRSVH